MLSQTNITRPSHTAASNLRQPSCSPSAAFLVTRIAMILYDNPLDSLRQSIRFITTVYWLHYNRFHRFQWGIYFSAVGVIYSSIFIYNIYIIYKHEQPFFLSIPKYPGGSGGSGGSGSGMNVSFSKEIYQFRPQEYDAPVA